MDRFSIRDGEDVAPEFVRAKELMDYEAGTRIDVAPQTSDRTIVATLKSAAPADEEHITVIAEEFEYAFIIRADALVYFADDED